nr:hypothetical protein BaRGS_024350 [Batillaria attramentaria]
MSANATSEFVGEPLTEGLRVTVLTLGWLACVNGVFGNVLIITTLLSQQALRSVHNIYIANLAVADLILSGYLLPMWLLDLYLGHHPVLNAAHCLLNSYGLCGTFSASVLTLLAISVNRYVSVCHYHIFIRPPDMITAAVLCAFLNHSINWIVYGQQRSPPSAR